MFRGGGCAGVTGPGQNVSMCSNVVSSFDPQTNTFTVLKDFNRVEHLDGEDGEEGGMGGKPPDMGGPPEGHGGEEGEEELYSRLPPIHFFFLVNNDPGTTTYFFEETIQNNTGSPWLGFLFAIKGEGAEVGAVKFLPGTAAANPLTVFPTLLEKGKKLQWDGGVLNPGESILFSFAISVGYVTPTDTEEDAATYRFLLQEFPLIEAEQVPEPGLFFLTGLGLAAIGVLRRPR